MFRPPSDWRCWVDLCRQANGKKSLRVNNIEGHYNNIHKGKVRLGFWIIGFAGYSGNYSAHTDCNSVSWIFIEEVAKVLTQNIHFCIKAFNGTVTEVPMITGCSLYFFYVCWCKINDRKIDQEIFGCLFPHCVLSTRVTKITKYANFFNIFRKKVYKICEGSPRDHERIADKLYFQIVENRKNTAEEKHKLNHSPNQVECCRMRLKAFTRTAAKENCWGAKERKKISNKRSKRNIFKKQE